MITKANINLAVSSMLDEGLPAPTILGILSGVVEGADRKLLPDYIGDGTKAWLDDTEARMKKLAAEESWTRLGQLLAKYEAVTKAGSSL
jgi:hypothetical protein